MTDASLVGRTLSDRYRIDTLLARGGMSLVYRAHDRRLERDVAIKVLAEPYAADDWPSPPASSTRDGWRHRCRIRASSTSMTRAPTARPTTS